LCIYYDLTDAEPYLVRLLSFNLSLQEIDELHQSLAQSDLRSNQLTYRLLRKLRCAKVSRIQVQTLNGFRVYREDQLLTDEEWGGSVPKLLLKSIIAHGCQRVPKQLVITDLWPDATESLAETNFKVNLHRLRKLLEPSILKDLGSSYVHLKENLITLNEDLFDIDVVKFTELLTEAKQHMSKGNNKKAVLKLKDAIELYHNDFLIEDLYDDTITLKRESLKQKLLDGLFTLAELYELSGSQSKAALAFKKIISIDPLSEQAYQKLMVNYSNRGNQSEAIKTYKKLEGLLKKEISARPSDITQSIYQKIIDA